MAKIEKLYRVWSSMRDRCRNPRCKDYRYYGGKGVSICKEWNEYAAFRKWAYDNGYSPDAGLTIDRIDVDGNYSPENCRWVTREVQANNMSSNHILTLNGESHNFSQWAKITGLPYCVIEARAVGYGWNAERTLTTPLNAHKTQYEFRGIKGNLKELSKYFGVNYHTLYNRIHLYGWDIERALTTEVKKD